MTQKTDNVMLSAHILGAIMGTFLKVWLMFWSIDQLFHYHIDFEPWNLLAGVIMVHFLSGRKFFNVQVVKQ